ncbi:MAG TPA: hypothetical protein PLC86_23410 [Candidatus Accumulibacter phosphatis]|nr:hypothetical protein [Candidatus Accumulibacter phosphatis]
MFEFLKRKIAPRIPPETQLRVLDECGIRLADGISTDLLMASISREVSMKQPFVHLLCVMGDQTDAENLPSLRFFSNNIWHLDTECIYGNGDYVYIMQRMSELAGGSLPLTEIEDYIDVEERKAWISFRFRTEQYKWQLKIDDDWIDWQIFTNLVHLLDSQTSYKRFTCIDIQGQDILIGFSTVDEMETLKARTGLKVDWLS